jgi:hypothetical protein
MSRDSYLRVERAAAQTAALAHSHQFNPDCVALTMVAPKEPVSGSPCGSKDGFISLLLPKLDVERTIRKAMLP